MQDLKDVTSNVHYENFRYNHLASVTNDGGTKSKTSSNKFVDCLILFNRFLINRFHLHL